MRRYDFLLTPATACAASGVDIEGPDVIAGTAVERHAWVAFSALGNFTGLPAASVPVGLTRDGWPIGLQIMGRHLDDLGVLAMSAAVEGLYLPAFPGTACPNDWVEGLGS